MIASLPMYDWASLVPAHDALWAGIRDRLRAGGHPAPDSLDRGAGMWEAWESPDLVLSQTCGLPYRSRLHGRVGLVGALDYALEDAPPGYYYSVFVVRPGDATDVAAYRTRCLAFNGQDSQSGWAAPQNHAATLGFRFLSTLHTGAHRDSARAVADGHADIAAVDAVTWRILSAELPDLAARLQAIGHTAPTPGLPLITAPGRDPGPIGDAVAAAVAGLDGVHASALGLVGFTRIPAAEYLSVPNPPPPSQDVAANL
jgi:hypothetical protein